MNVIKQRYQLNTRRHAIGKGALTAAGDVSAYLDNTSRFLLVCSAPQIQLAPEICGCREGTYGAVARVQPRGQNPVPANAPTPSPLATPSLCPSLASAAVQPHTPFMA